MAAVTAAVVAGVATTAAAGYSAYQGSKGGVSQHDPQFHTVPSDPLSESMRQYAARYDVSNMTTMPPSFRSALEAGGTDASMKTNWVTPGLTPEQAVAMGFTSGGGKTIPYASQSDLVAGQEAGTGTKLDPAQRMFLAKQHQQMALASGGDPNVLAPHSMELLHRANRINQLQARQTQLAAIQDPNVRQQRRLGRVQTKLATAQGKQTAALNA